MSEQATEAVPATPATPAGSCNSQVMPELPLEKIRTLKVKSLMEWYRGLRHILDGGEGDAETNWQAVINLSNQVSAEAARLDGIDTILRRLGK